MTDSPPWDALIEELAQQAIELRDSQGDPEGAALLERAARALTEAGRLIPRHCGE